jgi:hypothetical protein
MAVPAKAIDTSDVRAKADTSDRNLIFVYRIHECPKALESDGKPGHYAKLSVEESVTITCPTSADLDIEWYTSSYSDTQEDVANSYSSDISTPTWSGTSQASEYSTERRHPVGHRFGLSYYSTARIKYSRDDVASAAGYIYAVGIEEFFSRNYSGNDTSTRNMEYTERLGSDRLYTPDRTLSAWHAKNLLCESFNKMQEENRTYLGYPVIDFWSA